MAHSSGCRCCCCWPWGGGGVWFCLRRVDVRAAGSWRRAESWSQDRHHHPPHTPRQGQPLPKIETQGQDRVVFFLWKKGRNRIERSKMLACTEMITMCLQSAKHEHLRKQQELDHNQNQGFSLVQDVSTLFYTILHYTIFLWPLSGLVVKWSSNLPIFYKHVWLIIGYAWLYPYLDVMVDRMVQRPSFCSLWMVHIEVTLVCLPFTCVWCTAALLCKKGEFMSSSAWITKETHTLIWL